VESLDCGVLPTAAWRLPRFVSQRRLVSDKTAFDACGTAPAPFAQITLLFFIGLVVVRKTQKELEESGQREKILQAISEAQRVNLRLAFLLEHDERLGIAP